MVINNYERTLVDCGFLRRFFDVRRLHFQGDSGRIERRSHFYRYADNDFRGVRLAGRRFQKKKKLKSDLDAFDY